MSSENEQSVKTKSRVFIAQQYLAIYWNYLKKTDKIDEKLFCDKSTITISRTNSAKPFLSIVICVLFPWCW